MRRWIQSRSSAPRQPVRWAGGAKTARPICWRSCSRIRTRAFRQERPLPWHGSAVISPAPGFPPGTREPVDLRESRSSRRCAPRPFRAMAEMVSAEAALLWDRNHKALEEGSPAERAAAAQELGRSGRPEAMTRLLALAQQSPPSIASAAVRGLSEGADPSAVAPLAKLLDKKDPELRAAVCDVLGRLGDVDAAPLLEAVAVEASSASSFATAALISLPPQPAVNQLLCEVAARAGS